MLPTVLLGFVVAVFLVCIAPGPDMLFVLAHAVSGGRRAGLVAALGMSSGMAVHTLAVVFGLGAVVRAAPALLDGVRVVGALFLVYLAVSTWRASRKEEPPQQAEGALPTMQRQSLRKVYVMATLTNLANPKIILFYLAFLPQFLTTGQGSWPVTLQLLVLGTIFIVVGLLVDAGVALLAGAIAARLLSRLSVRRWLDRVAALIFGGLAVRLAFDIT